MVPARRHGFTLIEIAVVIAVIALIVGGIVAGNAMIRSAQLRQAVSDIQHLIQVTQNFRDKYKALPGDFTGATALWGSDSNCPNTAYNTVRKKATCNGNGSGTIYFYTLFVDPTIYESFRAIQHLANAGMIEGAYTGVSGPAGTSDFISGLNSPDSAVPGSVYSIEHAQNAETLNTNYFPGPYLHVIFFGAYTSNNPPVNPILTTQEALDIDTKLDDGRPAYGNVMAFKNGSEWTPNCTTTAIASTSAYRINSSGLRCSLIFKTGF